MSRIFIIAGAVILSIIIIFFAVWFIRVMNFRPTKNKRLQQERLNKDLEKAGFAYEIRGDYFYSLLNCWQRKVGYCRLYDEASPTFNMVMNCEPITFSYGGKRWLIELWKGQYGITTGAEIGIYNTDLDDIKSSKFTGTFYDNIPDSEMLDMAFVLRKNGRVLLKRSGMNWWITAFKLGEFSKPSQLTMDARITFANAQMRNAFLDSLINIGYTRNEFSVIRNTVTIHYTKPHTPQPKSQAGVQGSLVLDQNESYCRIFNLATLKYPDTLDKLEYIKASAPNIYNFLFDSLYSKAMFDSFGWLLNLRKGLRQTPTQEAQHPPRPQNPRPCQCRYHKKPICPPPPNPCWWKEACDRCVDGERSE